MSSRQEEKERRRKEREAAEAAAAARASRARRLRTALGAVLALAAIAVVVVVVAGGGDDGGDGGNGDGPTAAESSVPIPAQRIQSLDDAVAAAGCAVRTSEVEGTDHVEGEVEYNTNPPTSGDHNAVPAQDGVYAPGSAPAKEALVHSLEHGRIIVQYAPGTPARRVAQLETLLGETEGYHQTLIENNTDMPYAVAATAWTHRLVCNEFNDRVFDAIRAFRTRYVDKAPEFVP